jgi:alkanesulfonate monooxygenase SsuD/methylene tetrahydromethanopterin reductase-like flavin-dependent oxidoreductase (luciferase family)
MDDLPSHDERYASAEEYMEIVYQLWEKSWEDGVQTWQAEVLSLSPPSPSHYQKHPNSSLEQ